MSTKKDEKKAAKADKNEKNSKFALKLSELRRERGISQKKAATDLGISQALLSIMKKASGNVGLILLYVAVNITALQPIIF